MRGERFPPQEKGKRKGRKSNVRPTHGEGVQREKGRTSHSEGAVWSSGRPGFAARGIVSR